MGTKHKSIEPGAQDTAVARGRAFIDNPDDERLYDATRAMVVAARSWRKLANERIKPLNQTMARWETLFNVAITDDDITQRDLAQLVAVEGPTMARMLDRLARDGLIERLQCPVDRRVTRNRITAKGRVAVTEIMARTNEVRREILCEIDPEKLATCIEVLKEIIVRSGGRP